MFIASGAARDRLRIWSRTTAEVRDVPGAGGLAPRLHFVRISPDGKRALVSSADGEIVELEFAGGPPRSRWRAAGSRYYGVGRASYEPGAENLTALLSLDGDLWLSEGRF